MPLATTVVLWLRAQAALHAVPAHAQTLGPPAATAKYVGSRAC